MQVQGLEEGVGTVAAGCGDPDAGRGVALSLGEGGGWWPGDWNIYRIVIFQCTLCVVLEFV